MANFTLAPEEDDDFLFTQNCKISSRDCSGDFRKPTELQNLQARFDPRKVGFGISPWPGTEQPALTKDATTIAMDYLASKKYPRSQGDKK
jgi:hypothetical protein